MSDRIRFHLDEPVDPDIARGLPDELYADIEAESRRRNLSKSEVVRERLGGGRSAGHGTLAPAIADLVGSIDGLPADLSARTKHALRPG